MKAKELEKEAKRPDAFLLWLSQIFNSAVANVKLLGIVFAIIILASAAFFGYQSIQEKNESELQTKYSAIEKRLIETRQKLAEGERQTQAAAKAGKKETTVAAGPTGDLSKDYGDIPAQLQELVEAHPSSAAAEMAAIAYADLQIRYKNMTDAEKVLSLVNKSNSTSRLTSSLVVNLRAGMLADQNQCEKALPLWEKLTQDKKTAFLYGDSQLRMGLCYESLQRVDKAEAIYQGLISPNKDGVVVAESVQKEAERYLRLIRIKKAGGS